MPDTPTLIRRIRQDRGLTLGDVAKRMDCAPATVSRWEREPGRVTVPVLRNLARVLDCDVADLLRAGRARVANTWGVGIVRLDPITDEGEPCFLSRETLAALTDTPPDQLRVLRVVGDAMLPTLRDGDLEIVGRVLYRLGTV